MESSTDTGTGTDRGLRVLVVEDDRRLGELLRLALRRFTHHVQLATSGTEAVEVSRDDFDVVACDISLPDMSGLEVIERLREVQPGAGIVAVTGMVDVEVAVQSMKAGADDFVAKPFEPEILWHVLNKALDIRKQRIEASQAAAYRELAYTDALTGCPNRRFIDEFLDTAVRDAEANASRLAVAYVDVDNFKLLNDFVGHEQGDLVLRSLAETLHAVVQAPNVFARFGGDEFVIVFPGGSEQEADAVLEKLRTRVGRIEVENKQHIILPTRVSCGVAEFTGQETPRDLIGRAEDRMYVDKSLAMGSFTTAEQVNSKAGALVKASNVKALRSLVKAIDRRDSYTRFHSDHATDLALRVAHDLGLDEESVNGLMIGGPIHDLGKIVVPDEILRKPGPLTMEERRQMEEHPTVGAAITAAVTDYDTVVNLVRHHHERFDGNGYPGRMKGMDIPLTTRLFAIADAFSAMTTDRTYRKGWSYERALEQVRRGAGTQFDPELAAVFVRVIEEQGAAQQSQAA